MDDTTTWKGHSVTLFIFTGLVLLCSIFFILGMLVGRTQSERNASVAAVEAAIKADARPAPKESKPDLTFFDSVEKNARPVLEAPAPPVKAAAAPPPAAPPKPKTPPPPQNLVNYQVGAYRTQVDAEKSLGNVRKHGFKALILSPTAGEANPWYRVYVGPFADVVEAESVKRKLEAAGLKPILRK